MCNDFFLKMLILKIIYEKNSKKSIFFDKIKNIPVRKFLFLCLKMLKIRCGKLSKNNFFYDISHR
jgi:hypothetical protein